MLWWFGEGEFRCDLSNYDTNNSRKMFTGYLVTLSVVEGFLNICHILPPFCISFMNEVESSHDISCQTSTLRSIQSYHGVWTKTMHFFYRIKTFFYSVLHSCDNCKILWLFYTQVRAHCATAIEIHNLRSDNQGTQLSLPYMAGHSRKSLRDCVLVSPNQCLHRSVRLRSNGLSCAVREQFVLWWG